MTEGEKLKRDPKKLHRILLRDRRSQEISIHVLLPLLLYLSRKEHIDGDSISEAFCLIEIVL